MAWNNRRRGGRSSRFRRNQRTGRSTTAGRYSETRVALLALAALVIIFIVVYAAHH
jgi:hypothetical protein